MTNNLKLKKKIQTKLTKNLESPKDIFELFELLNYPKEILFDTSSKRRKSDFDFKKEDSKRIEEIYAVMGFKDKVTKKRKNLPVFLLETKTLTSSFIRSVTNTFNKQYSYFLLIFVVDYSEVLFVFPKREKVETGKHKLKLTKLVIDKDELINKKEHYTVIETLSNIYFDDEKNWRDVWRKWNKAFNVERVTKNFFEDYKNIFFTLRKTLNKQDIPRKECHEFTLQFLNRIMFIYFISKKRWLKYPKFIEWLWTSYKKLDKFGSDEFYEKWLRQVFFKAFNNRSNEIKELPEEVVKIISNAPFLNGGLFKENGLDEFNLKITDSMFQRIFEFFEKYNFTIKEDAPLDSEVAVDPQMIGYVYESLANVAEEIYDRNDLGIFYTPRVEVDFMCKRSLVEYLSKNMEDIKKEKFYHLVFDLPEKKDKIEKWFVKESKKRFSDKKKLWYKLEEVLDNLSVVDPACGSGAFLVGMLLTLTELYEIIYKHTGRSFTDFQLKNKIIQYSLYGVDVMPWAIHAAELRLWLQLIVETKFKKDELRKRPLLPNLNLNLRIGDSLVQEIGGISFNIRTNDLKPHLRKKLENLKQEKRKYYENSPSAKFKTPQEVKDEETRLFEEIIDERVESLETDIEVYEHEIKKAKSQKTLSGDYNVDKEKVEKNEKAIEKNEKEIEKLKKVKDVLKDPEKRPFVWDIDFAEIFSDKNGFDIVIGNPPYVRQEMISPPNKTKAEVSLEDRREYKRKLIKSVKTQFPVIDKIGKRSDYYIYFYFHGLSLLNKEGTFCFITSNSWLDVGYGKELQEFLCKYVPIHAIYDNPKRSFEHADVNTIIALFGSPEVKQHSLGNWVNGMNGGNGKIWPKIEHTAKFIMFKKPFQEVLSAKNLININKIKIKSKGGESITDLVDNVRTTKEYRVFPIKQEDLLEDGWEYPEDYEGKRFKKGKYQGNKWGGKFLRAPDIFYTILEKGKDKLVELGEIADVRFGIKTGANEFFYLDKDDQNKWKIEKEFLKPVIKSPRECKSIKINPKDLKYKVFMCHKSKKELKGTNALKYIEWGEQSEKDEKGNEIRAFHKRPTVSGRKGWWSLPKLPDADILFNQFFNDRFLFPWNKNYLLVDHAYYYILYPENTKKLVVALNSVINFFMVEIYGRTGLGQGALQTYAPEMKPLIVLDPKKMQSNEKVIGKKVRKYSSYKPKPIFEECGIDSNKPIREQEPKPLPDRAELDKIIFDELGLTKEERKEVYWAVCELVKQRLEKARSFKG